MNRFGHITVLTVSSREVLNRNAEFHPYACSHMEKCDPYPTLAFVLNPMYLEIGV